LGLGQGSDVTGREGREQGAGALMGLGRNRGGGVGKERLAGGGSEEM